MPVPVTLIFCGPLGSGSPILRVSVEVPAVGELKVKLNVHDEFAGTLVPQVLVSMKTMPFEPLHEMLVICSAVGPTFWKVTGRGPLVLPTVVSGKISDVGVMSTAV